MTEAEALDEAAKGAGWRDWKTLQLIARPDKQDDIRRHAKTIMENAALKAENERLRAIVKDAHSILSECKVTFGVCACGEDMETHGESHTPMDQAQVAVNRWFEAASAALKEIDNGDR